ncbi:PAS domain S-box protein [Halorientalis marina]|uniref:PAS domain S-box protein n=1 Tax=Halorientalis marina TaxID=2931976 RepID=UPI001FF35796|nr:PAS domain S-box protein [Halorientalis marina]
MAGSRILLVGVGHALPAGTTVEDCEATLAAAFPDRSVAVAPTDREGRAALDAEDEAEVDCVVSGRSADEEGLAFLTAIRERLGDVPVVALLAPGVEQVPAAALTADVTEWVRMGDHEDPVDALCRALPLASTDSEAAADLSPFGPAVDHYRQLVEHLADPVYLLGPAGYVEMVNEALLEEGGYDREELVGAHVSRVMPEKDIEKGAEIIAELLADPERASETVELEIIHDDGTRREYEDHISIVTDADGNLAGTVGIVRDIQERKERERELEQYETIVETVPEGVFVLDENANILAANEQCMELFGFSPDEEFPSNFGELVAEGRVDANVIPRYQSVVRDLLSSDSDTERGTYRYEAYPELDEDDPRIIEGRIALRPFDETFRGTIGVIQDVTERKQRIEELERYETIMQAVPDSVYATDEDGYYTFLNDAGHERFGLTEADIDSRSVHVSDVVEDDDLEAFNEANRRLLSDQYDTGEKAVVTYTAVTKDGRRFPAESHYALISVGEDGVAGAGITRDISDRERREQRLQVLDRILRHNLRNDLNAVLGNAELLERRFRQHDDEYGVDIARSIQGQTDRLVEMSREIRAIQHALERDRMDRPELDAVALVERVVAPFRAAESDVTIELDLPEQARVEGNEALELAVSNLVENAIEHNDRPEPEIEVGLRERDSDRGDWYELFVADDGPGIPEGEQVALQTDAEVTPLKHGTGIGLWAVAWIVSSFDGTVDISDRDPRGTVVTLGLRRVD